MTCRRNRQNSTDTRTEQYDTIQCNEATGIASQMVLAAVDFARANNRRIIPVCSYAQAVLTRTDEYQDILA